ncbi:MAG: YkgJ family cysteine cluster protein [Desulfosarcina sp.]|nr:YkgJ family cysteine cluster protein [Desulfobacterales bacterium]
MAFDLMPYFRLYEALSQAADQVFEKVKSEYPDCVKCDRECADCCYALFDLTLIEAIYLNARFKARFRDDAREAVLAKANRADRTIHKLKREAYRDLKAGKSEDDILADLATQKVRCPLLNDKDLCDLYDHRPITCRLYGIPTSIGGLGRTCALSGFEGGKSYPTVNIDKIHARLQEISGELLRDLKSKNIKLVDLLMPLSMALITDFDEGFLGIEPAEDDQ